MNIVRHRLQGDNGAPLSFQASPNIGPRLTPSYLVIHYTAGSSADESIRWLCNPAAKASAHIVIARDGTVTQLVPFDRVAWHAGVSQWNGLKGMNQHSIGIELDNAGRLSLKGGRWCTWVGRPCKDDEVMQAVHKHETTPSGWHVYTPEQLQATLEVSAALIEKYELQDVLGHEDISPGRKSDPGPAFPMESFHSRLMGRTQDEPTVFQTITAVNIRVGPGTEYMKLPESPLAAGTRLHVLKEGGLWRLVEIVDEVDGEADVQGWVRGDFLRQEST